MQNVHHTAEDGVTAFQGTEAALQERCKDAKLSPAEFQRKLSRCSLSTCRGMCCYGGVSVDDGTAAVLQRLSTERASDFRDMGLELPETVVAPTEWHGTVGNITSLKPPAPHPLRLLRPRRHHHHRLWVSRRQRIARNADGQPWKSSRECAGSQQTDRVRRVGVLTIIARKVVSYLFREHQAIMSEVKELICIAGWPWPLGLDRLDGDERVELLNQVFEVQNHGTAKQGQRRLASLYASDGVISPRNHSSKRSRNSSTFLSDPSRPLLT